MQLKKYPILRNLLFVQIGALILGVGVFSSVYYLDSRARYISEVSKIRQKVEPILAAHQEKWRAWKLLGMEDALREQLEIYKKELGLEKLSIVSRGEITEKEKSDGLVFPRTSKADPDAPALVAMWNVSTSRDGSDLVFYSVIGILLLLLSLVAFSARYIRKHVYLPLLQLNSSIQSFEAGSRLDIDQIQASGEIREFLEMIKEMHEKIQEAEKHHVITQMARQVAHDIRSPLAALEILQHSTENLPEDLRLVTKLSVNRIKDIANSLLDRSRDLTRNEPVIFRQSQEGEVSGSAKVELISALVESIVAEKRLTFRNRSSFEIDCVLDKTSYGAFAKVDSIEFKRMISNLIDNGVDAIENDGKIEILVKADNEEISVFVKDNGKGIPREILDRLLKSQISWGKKCGNGLGLFHAQMTMKKINGIIRLESKIDEGTQVFLKIPRAETPRWFGSEIPVFNRSQIVILDDDLSVHHMWAKCFSEILISYPSLGLIHFNSIQEFRDWFDRDKPSRTFLLLVDFQFEGMIETGLNLVEELNLEKSSLLVTSYYDEPRVQAECLRLGIKMIPKSEATVVPIVVTSKLRAPRSIDSGVDLVL